MELRKDENSLLVLRFGSETKYGQPMFTDSLLNSVTEGRTSPV
jgi:hypothetical protein